jgi:hypothetical protein
MSQSGVYGSGGSGGSGITTLAGDVGSATGSTVNVITGFTAGPYANGTPSFTGSGNTLQLSFSDANSNIGIGLNALAGAAAESASANIAIGNNAASNINGGGENNIFIGDGSGGSVTSSSFNQGIGVASLSSLLGGQNNIAIGFLSGSNLTGVESSNIYLNSLGVVGESNVLRIGGGSTLQLNQAFIGGIEGVNVGSVAQVVSISGNQLGSTILTAGSGVTITPGAGTITIASTGGGSGALVLIQTQTASSQTALTFTTGITGTYNNYQLITDSLVPATTPSSFNLQISIDGGATYISTNYAGGLNGMTLIGLAVGDSTFNYATSNLYNFTVGAGYVCAITTSITIDLTVPDVGGGTGNADAYLTPATVVNAFQLVTSDSTAFSGTFSLYGITS